MLEVNRRNASICRGRAWGAASTWSNLRTTSSWRCSGSPFGAMVRNFIFIMDLFYFRNLYSQRANAGDCHAKSRNDHARSTCVLCAARPTRICYKNRPSALHSGECTGDSLQKVHLFLLFRSESRHFDAAGPAAVPADEPIQGAFWGKLRLRTWRG